MTRRMALMIVAMTVSAPRLGAQPSAVRTGNEPCFRARPYPACRVFFLTNAGGYVRLGAGTGGSPMRATVDWGAMVNLTPTTAIGGSWFVNLDENEFSTGPVLHWRRWLGPSRSVDVAVGTPIASGNALRPGTVLGLVKYNPVHWFGVAVRPELVKSQEIVCDAVSCTVLNRTRSRLYVGAEAGWLPGLGLGLGAGLALGVLIVAVLASGGID